MLSIYPKIHDYWTWITQSIYRKNHISITSKDKPKFYQSVFRYSFKMNHFCSTENVRQHCSSQCVSLKLRHLHVCVHSKGSHWLRWLSKKKTTNKRHNSVYNSFREKKINVSFAAGWTDESSHFFFCMPWNPCACKLKRALNKFSCSIKND